MQKEASAWIKINRLRELAGWRFFKGETGPATVLLESHVKHEELGDDFEHAGHGYVRRDLKDNSVLTQKLQY